MAEPQNYCLCPEKPNALYPRHPAELFLWAAGVGTPCRYVDNDPRLEKPGKGDTTKGQDGWSVALEFSNFANLAKLLGGDFMLPAHCCNNLWQKCGAIDDNQIRRLGIVAHGGAGLIDIDSVTGVDCDTNGPDSRYMTAANIANWDAHFATILKKLAWRSTVMMMSCTAANGPDGEVLMKAISLKWAAKEVYVVGYRSILYSDAGKGAQAKGGGSGSCYAGCRETHVGSRTGAGSYKREWNDLTLLPWADLNTMHSRIAHKGALIKDGLPPS